jgi:hypothetical protein
MQVWEKNSSFFLLSFSGYIRSSFEAGLLEKDRLMKLIDEGMSLAKHSNEPLNTILFTLLYYEIEDHNAYYPYMNEIAIPFFKKNGQFSLLEQYEKRLFSHYSHTQQIEKAITVAQSLIKI